MAVPASENREEALGRTEPSEELPRKRTRLVREDRERSTLVAEPSEHRFDATVQSRVIDKVFLVVTEERGEDSVGLAGRATGRRETSSDQTSHALPHESEDGRFGEGPATQVGESCIRSVREVSRGVDERPVEVEDVVAEAPQTENEEPQPQVRSAFGFTNLNPAPWRPST
jgi:hypothetical protein